MVAVLRIGDDDMEFLEHLCLPATAQLLDLLYAHFKVRLLAWYTSDR